MRGGLLLAAFVLALHVTPAAGQTAIDIEMKYGKPVNAYSVSDSVWMTPEYTGDGQVCRMRLYPKRISGNANYLSKELPFEEFNKAVEGLLPVSKRGAKTEPFGNGLWMFWGGVRTATFRYDRVTITYSAGVGGRAETMKGRRKESEFFDLSLDFGDAAVKAAGAGRPEDDFLPYHKSTAEVVTITWNDRKCGAQ